MAYAALKLPGTLYLLIGVVVLSACSGPSNPNKGIRPTTTSTCPVDEVTWTSATDGFDKEQSLKLSASLEAAAKADAQRIKAGQVSTDAGFGVAFTQLIKETSARSFKVSQELTELSVNLRNIECQIYAGMFTGERRARAENTVLDLVTKFQDQKKSLESQEK